MSFYFVSIALGSLQNSRVFFHLLFLLVLKITGNNLLHIFLGDKESFDCEQGCDTYNTNNGADGIAMVNNNVSGDREDKNLKNICGGKVNQHAYKLKTDNYTEYILKEVLAVGKVSVNLKSFNEYLRYLGKE